MNQQEVRSYIERYLAAFDSHVVESHPDYYSVKLTEEVDKDIGNRPFYWSWVERMNLPRQPLTLTFYFDPEKMPQGGIRAEAIHFGAGRMQQIFQSTCKHGRFVCLYEHNQALMNRRLLSTRRTPSAPLTPWLNLNLKISFICDKKRDILLYLGINLHQPRIVHDFYTFLEQINLTPSIPDYFYTLGRSLSLSEAVEMATQEVNKLIEAQDHEWAELARQRLAEELEILELYYSQMPDEEREKPDATREGDEKSSRDEVAEALTVSGLDTEMATETAEPATVGGCQHQSQGGRILDFLRMNGIPAETPKSEIDQTEWKQSTPEQEKARRIAELQWQYEPRIEVKFVNGGLFYLHNMPPFSP